MYRKENNVHRFSIICFKTKKALINVGPWKAAGGPELPHVTACAGRAASLFAVSASCMCPIYDNHDDHVARKTALHRPTSEKRQTRRRKDGVRAFS